MGQWHFLNSTGDMGNNKRQRHATLSFLEIDMRHQDPLSRAPKVGGNLSCSSNTYRSPTKHQVLVTYRPGGGGTDSLSLSTNCETTAPPYLDKGQPLFCYLQIYSPLFSWVPKDSPWKSTMNNESSILNI